MSSEVIPVSAAGFAFVLAIFCALPPSQFVIAVWTNHIFKQFLINSCKHC